jgi:hypothetical protein
MCIIQFSSNPFSHAHFIRLIYNHIHRKIQYKLTLERTSQENNGADPYLDSLERHGADGIDGIIHPPADTNLDPVISEIMREKPSDDICFTVVGALLWPTISNIIGG